MTIFTEQFVSASFVMLLDCTFKATVILMILLATTRFGIGHREHDGHQAGAGALRKRALGQRHHNAGLQNQA